MDEFLWMVGLKLMEMRLAIEGALNLYAEIAGPLYRKEDAEGSARLDTIENALHGIRERIWELQIQYKQASRKLIWRGLPQAPSGKERAAEISLTNF